MGVSGYHPLEVILPDCSKSLVSTAAGPFLSCLPQTGIETSSALICRLHFCHCIGSFLLGKAFTGQKPWTIVALLKHGCGQCHKPKKNPFLKFPVLGLSRSEIQIDHVRYTHSFKKSSKIQSTMGRFTSCSLWISHTIIYSL